MYFKRYDFIRCQQIDKITYKNISYFTLWLIIVLCNACTRSPQFIRIVVIYTARNITQHINIHLSIGQCFVLLFYQQTISSVWITLSDYLWMAIKTKICAFNLFLTGRFCFYLFIIIKILIFHTPQDSFLKDKHSNRSMNKSTFRILNQLKQNWILKY